MFDTTLPEKPRLLIQSRMGHDQFGAMKAAIFAVLFALIGIDIANAVIDIPVSPEERAQLDSLNSRLSEKDVGALSEVVVMRPEIAVRYLEHSILHGDADESRTAAELIARVANYRQYFSERLILLSGRKDTDSSRDDIFRALGKIRTADAIRIAGPSLFDDRVVWPTARDTTPAPNSILALDALVAMEIPGAPTKWQSSYTADDFKKWQEWWKENEARIDEVLKEAKDGAGSERSPKGTVPVSSSHVTLPARTVALEPRTAQTPAPVVDRKPAVWRWLVGIVTLAVIVSLVWKRRGAA